MKDDIYFLVEKYGLENVRMFLNMSIDLIGKNEELKTSNSEVIVMNRPEEYEKYYYTYILGLLK